MTKLSPKQIENRRRAGREGAKKTHRLRIDTLVELSKYVNKNDLNWLQAKWKTTHLVRLLEAYQK